MVKDKGSVEPSAKIDYGSLGYDKKDVVSWLIKSMRLGDIDNAFYAFKVMVDANESYHYFSRLMIRFCYEDCWGAEALLVSDACWRSMMIQKQKGMRGNTPYFWIRHLTFSPKFWEIEEGRKAERAWWAIEDEVKARGFTREVPRFALDSHSRTGWEVKKETGRFPDCRFGGTRYGRLSMCDMYARLGRLDPNTCPRMNNGKIEIVNEEEGI